MERCVEARKTKIVIASVRDSIGRTVVLEKERWEHILEGHSELDGLELTLMRTVENADKRGTGNFPGATVLYKENVGPAKWLAVVVEYDGLQGRVVTAYPCKEPKSAI